jgi:hypothetical protein
MIKGARIMSNMKQGMRLIAILVGVAGTSCLIPSEAAPPGGGLPPGKVFYMSHTALQETGQASLGSWSMNADGSGKQLLGYQPHLSDYAQLSNQVHQGHRWYLEFRTSPTPANGVAVFAVRDDGEPNFAVLLADPAALSLGHFRWAKDDSFISIAAMPEIINPDGSRGIDPNALDRIYAAEIAFDPDTGLPALTIPLVIVAEGEQPGQSDIRNHDWSPYGDEIVYQLTGNPGPTSAMIAELVTGTTRLFAAGGSTPVWSPDGRRIAYWLSDGIYVSNPEGTARSKITTNNSSRYDETAGWSLDSQQVLFNRTIIKSVKGGGQQYQCDVMRVPATGGTAVNLTKDIDGYDRAVYWR